MIVEVGDVTLELGIGRFSEDDDSDIRSVPESAVGAKRGMTTLGLDRGLQPLPDRFSVREVGPGIARTLPVDRPPTGGLADTPAALLTGNVSNQKNPQEKVVGYFSVTNNSVRRYWLTRADGLQKGWKPLANLNPPVDPPIPTPPLWQPVPCKPGRNRTPFKPWGWIE